MGAANSDALSRLLGEQPPWSDLRLLILTRSDADSTVLHGDKLGRLLVG
jgi:hypothetical protein